MFGSLIAAIKADAAEATNRIVRKAIGIVVALTGAIIILVALLRALYVVVAFYWRQGPLIGHLSVAAVALLVVIAGSVVAFSRGKQRPSQLAAIAQRPGAQIFDIARGAGALLSSRTARRPVRQSRVPSPSTFTLALCAVFVGVLLGRRF